MEDSSLMPETVLLAEDSPDDEFFFKRVLRAAGVKNPVVVVRDGAEAISYLEGRGQFEDRQKHPLPRVLFLDLHMPKINGREVLEWLKGQTGFYAMRVVVLTASIDAKGLQEMYTPGAHSFLPKPFSLADMETLVHHFDGCWIL